MNRIRLSSEMSHELIALCVSAELIMDLFWNTAEQRSKQVLSHFVLLRGLDETTRLSHQSSIELGYASETVKRQRTVAIRRD